MGLPAREYLAECFDYNPATGAIIWRPRPAAHFRRKSGASNFNSQFAGRAAGVICPNGYVRIKIDGRIYAGHRIAWFMATGEEPGEIDHRDRCGSNNSLANLRPATRQENCLNRGARSDNATGLKGVSPYGRGRWRARIFLNGKSVLLGLFDTPEAAAVAYMVAHADAHGIETAIAPHHRAACEEFFLSLANRDTRAGHRTIPGFIVEEERRAL